MAFIDRESLIEGIRKDVDIYDRTGMFERRNGAQTALEHVLAAPDAGLPECRLSREAGTSKLFYCDSLLCTSCLKSFYWPDEANGPNYCPVCGAQVNRERM